MRNWLFTLLCAFALTAFASTTAFAQEEEEEAAQAKPAPEQKVRKGVLMDGKKFLINKKGLMRIEGKRADKGAYVTKKGVAITVGPEGMVTSYGKKTSVKKAGKNAAKAKVSREKNKAESKAKKKMKSAVPKKIGF